MPQFSREGHRDDHTAVVEVEVLGHAFWHGHIHNDNSISNQINRLIFN